MFPCNIGVTRRTSLELAGMAAVAFALNGAGRAATALADTAASVSGVFEGVAEGHNGPVTVDVEVKDGSIVDVQVVDHKESKGVSDAAVDKLPARIVEANSIGVDGITGATFTSNAILTAAQSALAAAGLDPEAYREVPTVERKPEHLEADVAVVGAGVAGLSAALKAAQEGKDVVLFEKTGVIGGNCIFSAGLIVTAGTSWQRENGVEDSPEQYVEDLIRPDSPYLTDNPVMSLTMHRGAAAKVEDLRSWGLEFVDFDAKQPRIHTIAPKAFAGGDTLITLLTSMCEDAGVRILVDTKVEEILADGEDAVIGLRATGPDADVSMDVPVVILATGGYTSNPDLVTKYAPDVADLPSLSGVGTTGDGLLMAQNLGGYAYGTDEGMQMFLVNNRGFDMPQVFNLSSCILVNEDGERFVDESVVYTTSARESANQKDRTVFIVFDDTAREMYAPYEDYFEQGVVMEAPTIEELADMLGIPGLVATVERYNAMVDDGEDRDFGRATNFEKIGGEHLYGIVARPYIYNSYGGVRIDEGGRVVRQDGSAIVGLYAAGEVTGSVERQEGRDYTSGLAQGLSYGTLAANTAVGDLG